jgi:putative ABC transport system substrate-binding protein
MSYGPIFPNIFRRSADFVDKVLRGCDPAEITIEQPTKFELVVNLTDCQGARTHDSAKLSSPAPTRWSSDDGLVQRLSQLLAPLLTSVRNAVMFASRR